MKIPDSSSEGQPTLSFIIVNNVAYVYSCVIRHCKFNATMAHMLTHWRFDVNEWVVDYLSRQGVLSDENVLERSRWSVRRQTKYANEVFDMMVQTGEVQSLWRDFHITKNEARESGSY